MALVAAVQQSRCLIAAVASCSVAAILKNAEPLPVICQPSPSFLANSLTLGSTCSAALRSSLGGSPLTSSHARYTSAVLSSMPGQAMANHGVPGPGCLVSCL